MSGWPRLRGWSPVLPSSSPARTGRSRHRYARPAPATRHHPGKDNHSWPKNDRAQAVPPQAPSHRARSSADGVDRNEIGALLVAAGRGSNRGQRRKLRREWYALPASSGPPAKTLASITECHHSVILETTPIADYLSVVLPWSTLSSSARISILGGEIHAIRSLTRASGRNR